MRDQYSQSMTRRQTRPALSTALGILLLVLAAGCGSSSSSPAAGTPTDTGGARTSGDIADTAVYLTYAGSGYRIKYVEGWGIQLGPGQGVTISDKDSAETVALTGGNTALPAVVSRDLRHLRGTLPHFHLLHRGTVQLAPGRSVYLQYSTLSPPDQVTSKRVPVVVDRYYVPGAGKYATVTLSTPVGVDNVDAFRLIARSFRWHQAHR